MLSKNKKRIYFRNQRSLPPIIWLFIVILIVQVGCVHRPYILPRPPSEEIRKQLGTIGVVSARFTPEVEYLIPAKGAKAGAGRGAATGAEKGLEFWGEAASGCSDEDCALLILLLPPAVIIGGIVGSVKGADKAESTVKVEEAEATLNEVFASLKIQEAMRDRFLQVAQYQTHHHFVLLVEKGPSATEEELTYHSMVNQGIDTVLEISILELGLVGEWDVNPPLALVMNLHTRLIQILDETVLYDSKLEYKSGKRIFTEWAANDAQLFLEELDRSCQSLAEKIVDELFLLYLPLELREDDSP